MVLIQSKAFVIHLAVLLSSAIENVSALSLKSAEVLKKNNTETIGFDLTSSTYIYKKYNLKLTDAFSVPFISIEIKIKSLHSKHLLVFLATVFFSEVPSFLAILVMFVKFWIFWALLTIFQGNGTEI